jgi:anti-anti-sigma regulatory factor
VIGRLLAWWERSECADDMTMLLLTASDGVSSFDDGPVRRASAALSGCALSVGTAEGATWVAVRGHATWKDAAVLRATCVAAFDANRSVVVDLTCCTMLDSTLLGTLHELVVRAEPRLSLHLRGVSDEIRGVFEELAMTKVLSTIAPGKRTAPASMVDLHPEGDAGQTLVLHAHELLAGLSETNAEQFQPVIDALQCESLH